jgi:hypothetical protein
MLAAVAPAAIKRDEYGAASLSEGKTILKFTLTMALKRTVFCLSCL